MSSPVVVRSPQDFLNALKEMPDAKIAQPEQTLEQVTARIDELSAALQAGTAACPALVGDIRAAVEAQRADLIRQQFVLVHGYVPDADGNNPAEVKAIVATEAATKSVIDALESESIDPNDEEEEEADDEDGLDFDEQVEVLNEIDEADAVVVSPAEPTMTPAPLPVFQAATEAILVPPEAVMAFRASVAGNLPHVTARLVTMFLGK